jgi:hypothetical protein
MVVLLEVVMVLLNKNLVEQLTAKATRIKVIQDYLDKPCLQDWNCLWIQNSCRGKRELLSKERHYGDQKKLGIQRISTFCP